MTATFTPATRTKALLRLAIDGPSGSGKTFTALRIATGLGGRIAFIDTERGSASKYAPVDPNKPEPGTFAFDVANLDDRTSEGYLKAMQDAAEAGYNVLIVDTMSHEWLELLQEVDQIAQASFSGNTWAAWSKGTPKQNRFIDALLNWPGHVIATMRVKTAWEIQDDKQGRKKPQRVGLAPVQGKDIEYEFDMLISMTPEHYAHVQKDRTGKYQDAVFEKPGEDLGKALAEWLAVGTEPPPAPKYQAPPTTAPPRETQPAPASTGKTCPDCGKPMVERTRRDGKGKFLGCTGYPNCKHTEKVDEDQPAPPAGGNGEAKANLDPTLAEEVASLAKQLAGGDVKIARNICYEEATKALGVTITESKQIDTDAKLTKVRDALKARLDQAVQEDDDIIPFDGSGAPEPGSFEPDDEIRPEDIPDAEGLPEPPAEQAERGERESLYVTLPKKAERVAWVSGKVGLTADAVLAKAVAELRGEALEAEKADLTDLALEELRKASLLLDQWEAWYRKHTEANTSTPPTLRDTPPPQVPEEPRKRATAKELLAQARIMLAYLYNRGYDARGVIPAAFKTLGIAGKQIDDIEKQDSGQKATALVLWKYLKDDVDAAKEGRPLRHQGTK